MACTAHIRTETDVMRDNDAVAVLALSPAHAQLFVTCSTLVLGGVLGMRLPLCNVGTARSTQLVLHSRRIYTHICYVTYSPTIAMSNYTQYARSPEAMSAIQCARTTTLLSTFSASTSYTVLVSTGE